MAFNVLIRTHREMLANNDSTNIKDVCIRVTSYFGPSHYKD